MTDSEKKKGSLTRYTGRVSAGIMISRVLGLVRLLLFAWYFNASAVTDAFFIAFRIPNLLRDLFAEGALSMAFIPAFSDKLLNHSKQEAYALANRILTLLTAAVGVIVVAGILFAPGIVSFLKNVEKFELTVRLVRLLMPFLLFISLAALFMGMLNVQKVFFLPAFAPAMFNIICISMGIFLFATRRTGGSAIFLWALATLLGGFAQFAVQVPALHKKGFRYKPDFRIKDAGTQRVLKHFAPAVLGLAAPQISILVNTILVGNMDQVITWHQYAFRLIYFPVGLFSVAISIVNTIYASRSAASRDQEELKDNLARSLRLNFFLTMAAMAGFMVLGRPITRVIWEHFSVTASTGLNVYYALFAYSFCLWAYGSVKIMAHVFYALKSPKIPVLASAAAVTGNLIVALLTYQLPIMQTRGLGLVLAFSTGQIINFSVLALFFSRKFGRLGKERMGSSILQSSLAVLVMAAGLFLLRRLPFLSAWENGSLGYSILSLLLLILAGTLILFLTAGMLRLREAGELLALFKKIGRQSSI